MHPPPPSGSTQASRDSVPPPTSSPAARTSPAPSSSQSGSTSPAPRSSPAARPSPPPPSSQSGRISPPPSSSQAGRPRPPPRSNVDMTQSSSSNHNDDSQVRLIYLKLIFLLFINFFVDVDILKMLTDENVLEEIPGNCPTVFARNLFMEMFDGRIDLVVTDSGRQPSNSTRTPISLQDVNFIKSMHFNF